jgi:GGDEF domain-containing protein
LYDEVQMDKRLKLQELAHDLRSQATTDYLTGLSNRLKFNQRSPPRYPDRSATNRLFRWCYMTSTTSRP